MYNIGQIMNLLLREAGGWRECFRHIDDRMVYWKNRSDDNSWLDGLSDWLLRSESARGLTVIDTRDRWSSDCIYDLIKRIWLALLLIVKDQIETWYCFMMWWIIVELLWQIARYVRRSAKAKPR